MIHCPFVAGQSHCFTALGQHLVQSGGRSLEHNMTYDWGIEVCCACIIRCQVDVLTECCSLPLCRLTLMTWKVR